MNIVFTGKLEETRKELEETLEQMGHHLQKNVTYDTDMVVVGVRADHFIDDGYSKKSTKEKAAERKGIKILHVDSIQMMAEYFI